MAETKSSLARIDNLNLGGIAESNYQGNKNTVAEAIGLDIHSEGGLIKVNQALKDDNTGTGDNKINDNVILVSVSGGGGYIWAFGTGTDRKVWKKTVSTNTWTYQGQVTSSFDDRIFNAFLYNGYIYYTGGLYLGRIGVADAWASRDDDWATFSSSANDHPMRIVNDTLYIGDHSLIAQVDGGVFSANALDIASDLIITALGKSNTDLLIGTKNVYDSAGECEIFKWNTWSDSWSYADTVPEKGINAFLEIDNFIMVNAGVNGKIYLFDGYRLDPYKKIKGNYGNSATMKVYVNAVLNFGGIGLFGVSNLNGNPSVQGIWSLARTNKDTPFVLNIENKISTSAITNLKISSMCLYPTSAGDQYMVSWRSGVAGSYVYGVDIIDLENKEAISHFISKVIYVSRCAMDEYKIISVPYKNLPEGTNIKIYKKLNNGATFDEITTTNDTKRQMIEAKAVVGSGGVLQMKIELIANDNTAPEVEGAELIIN